MNSEKKYLTILLIILFNHLIAQDIQFSQFYSASTYVNPAFAGSNVCSRISLIYRNQWPGITKTYSSYLFAFDHSINGSLGIGLNIGVDEAGSGHLKTTNIDPVLSYGVNLNRHSSLRLGIQPGVSIKSIDFNKLLFGDQIYRGGKNIATYEAEPVSTSYFDVGAGILYNSRSWWFGISTYHLNKPYDAFYSQESLPVKMSAHSGITLNLNDPTDLFNVNDKTQAEKKTITIAFNYKKQKKFDQFDLGLYYTKSVFTVGVWYRGIPVLKAYKPGYPNNESVIFLFGVAKERFNIGYSYDLTISYLSTATFGAHEITMSYQFCKPKKTRKRKLVLVSCPKF